MILLGLVLLVLGIALFLATSLGFVPALGSTGTAVAGVLVVAGLALVLVGARRARSRETMTGAPSGAPSSAGGWVPPPSTPASPTGTSAPESPTAASRPASEAQVSGSNVAAPTTAPASPTGERAPESPTAASRPASEAPPPPGER